MAREKDGERDDDNALEALAREVRALFHRLRIATEEIHQRPELSVAHRTILEHLVRDGTMTVPDLARACGVSRQNVQQLVNRLSGAGMIETLPNPRHRRSPLVAATSSGRKQLAEVRKIERRAVKKAQLPIKDKELRQARETLKAVREFLESEVWRERIAR